MGWPQFFELTYGSAAAGKTNSRGVPNLLHAALIARHYQDEFVLASPPLLVQTCVFGLLAPLARVLGYSATIDCIEEIPVRAPVSADITKAKNIPRPHELQCA